MTTNVCPNCNAEIPDGETLCPSCGTEIASLPKTGGETAFCPECGAKTASDAKFCPQCGKTIRFAETNSQQYAPPISTKKPFPKMKLLFIVLLVVIVIGSLIAAFKIFGSGGGSVKPYILYFKDMEINFTYLSNPEPYEITGDLISASDIGNAGLEASKSLSMLIFFSDDKRYMFYPDKADEDSMVTYYYRDMKKDSTKEDTSVKIDNDISLNISSDIPIAVNEKGTKFFYIKGADERRLYVYDRDSGEKTKLDEGVLNFRINGAGNYLIYTKNDEDDSDILTLYEMTVNDDATKSGEVPDPEKIDTCNNNYDSVHMFAEDRKVFYLKDDLLYFKEADVEKQKIDSDVVDIVSIINGTSVYYVTSTEVKTMLSEFIDDDMISDDASISAAALTAPTEPSEEDYQTREWVGSSWGGEWNEEKQEWGYWNIATDYDAYNAAVEKYYADLEAYRSITFRNNLRAALALEENAYVYNQYALNFWSGDGKSVTVAPDILFSGYFHGVTSAKTPVCTYFKHSTETKDKLKMSMINQEYRLNNDDIDSTIGMIKEIIARMISDSNAETDELSYIAINGIESTLETEDETLHSIKIMNDGTVYFIDDWDDDDGCGTLMSALTSGDTLAKPVKIDEDVNNFRFFNDKLYYLKDEKDGSGDLCAEGKTIATDVYFSSCYNIADSDVLLYLTDFSHKNQEGTLCCFNSEEIKIADDVAVFLAVDDKNIAYLIDYNYEKGRGDLFLYDGGKTPVEIDSDVAGLIQIG